MQRRQAALNDEAANAGLPAFQIGIGVNTGVAYVGSIGDSSDTELTAMGDVVNVTARLASVAAAGEVDVGVRALHQ